MQGEALIGSVREEDIERIPTTLAPSFSTSIGELLGSVLNVAQVS